MKSKMADSTKSDILKSH